MWRNKSSCKNSSVNVSTVGGENARDIVKHSLKPSDRHHIPATPVLLKGRLARWNAKVEGLAGLEARGITRVLPEEKHDGGLKEYLQIFTPWFGMNLVGVNLVVRFFGPLIFSLDWVD